MIVKWDNLQFPVQFLRSDWLTLDKSLSNFIHCNASFFHSFSTKFFFTRMNATSSSFEWVPKSYFLVWMCRKNNFLLRKFKRSKFNFSRWKYWKKISERKRKNPTFDKFAADFEFVNINPCINQVNSAWFLS